MTQKIVHRLVIGAAVLAMSAAMGVASAAEAQQTATYQVQKAEGQVQKVTVVSAKDGSFVVIVDGVKFEGAEAAQVLAANGIVLNVSATGEIETTSVSDAVRVVVAPKAVEAPSKVQAAEPSLPSNTMAGSGLAVSGAAQGTLDSALGTPAVKPYEPVSR